MSDLNFSVNANVSDAAAQFNKLWQEYINGSRSAALEVNKLLGGDVVKKLQVRIETDNATGIRTVNGYLKESLTAVDKIAQAYDKVNKIQRGSVTSLRQQVNEAKQARDRIEKYGASAAGLFAKIRQINPEWANQNDRVKELNRQLAIAESSNFWDRLKATTNLGGFLSIGNQITQLVTTFQSLGIIIQQLQAPIKALESSLAGLQAFQLSFKAIGISAEGAGAALQESTRIALGLGASVRTVRDGFQRLSPVVLQSGGTIGDVADITESLASRFAAFGLSADASRRVMNGVIQAFAKGKLQAEELTQQISEADPAFKVDFANALNVSVQRLEELVKAGEVTTDVLIKTLPALTKSSLLYGKLGDSAVSAVSALNKSNNALGGVSVTTEQVRNQLNNLTQLNLERLAVALQPVVNAFLRAQAVVVDFVTYISQLEGIRGLGNIIAALGDSVINLVDALARVTGAVAAAISPILQLIGAIVNTGPGVAIITTLIGVKLVAAIGSLSGAIVSSLGSFAQLGVNLAQSTLQYGGLGTAAQLAADKVVAAQAKIAAASAASGGARGAGAAVTGASIAASYLPKEEIAKAIEANKKIETAAKGAALTNAELNKQLTANAIASSANAAAASKGAGATNMFASAAKTLKSAFTAATAPLAGVGLAIAGVVAASASVAVAIGVYKSVMSDADDISKKTAASIKELETALTELGVVTGKTGNAWDNTVEEIGFVGATFEFLKEALGGAAIQTAKYNQATIAAARGSEQFRGKIDQLTNEYNRLKASNDGSTKAKQKEKQAEDALKSAYASRIASLETLIAAKQKEKTGDRGAQEARNRLIDLLKSEVQALQAEASARGVSNQRLQEQAIAAGLASKALGELNSALKEVKAKLENVDFGTKEFKEAAVQAAVLKLNIDKVSKTAEDPLYLFKVLPDFIKEASNEVAKLSGKNAQLKKQLSDISSQRELYSQAANTALLFGDRDTFNFYTEKLKELQVEEGRFTSELQKNESALKSRQKALNDLIALDTEIKIKLAIDELDFQSKIAKINSQFTKDEFRFRVGLDQGEFRNIVLQVTEFKSQIDSLLRDRAKLQVQLQRPSLTDSERQNINRELLENAAQVRALLASGAADLRDAGYRLRQSLTDAVEQLRNLKLSNLRFLPVEQQREAIRALNSEVQRIAEQKGLRVTFTGTPEQILQEKRAFVDFYTQVDKTNKTIADLQNAIKFVDEQLRKIAESGVTKVFEGISTSMTKAAEQIYKAAETLLGLDGKTINIQVNYSGMPQSRWTGGPVSGGSTYQVNELGREMFLSNSGRLSYIKAPSWGSWTAPSGGTVIPAHVAAGIDIPRTGVQLSSRSGISQNMPTGVSGTNKLLASLVGAVRASMAPRPDSGLAAVVASQAVQLGKLTHAVNELTDKDWNVNVKVRNTGSGAYLDALNRRM